MKNFIKPISALSFVILFFVVFIFPQFKVRIEPVYSLILVVMIVLVPLFDYFLIKKAVFSRDWEELEIHVERLVKIFLSKTTAVSFVCVMICNVILLVIESVTTDLSLHFFNAYYSLDKIMLMMTMFGLFVILCETFQTYINITKGFKDSKK